MGIETLAIGSLVAGVGSGIVGAIGAGQRADAEAGAANYKAAVARNNAIIAERNAATAKETGAIEGQRNDLKTKNIVSTQLVTQAANGLDVNTGTNVDLRQSAADLGRLDTLTIISNAAKQATGYLAQAMNFTAESDIQTATAKNAEAAGELNIMSSLLGSAGSVADKWIGYKSKGVF